MFWVDQDYAADLCDDEAADAGDLREVALVVRLMDGLDALESRRREEGRVGPEMVRAETGHHGVLRPLTVQIFDWGV